MLSILKTRTQNELQL